MRRLKALTIVGACRDCGDIRLPVADVTMVLLDGIVFYDCPGCGQRIEKPSPLHTEQHLLAAGCRLVLQ